MKLFDIYLYCANVDLYPTLRVFNKTGWHVDKMPSIVYEGVNVLDLPEWFVEQDVLQFYIHPDGSLDVLLRTVESPE